MTHVGRIGTDEAPLVGTATHVSCLGGRRSPTGLEVEMKRNMLIVCLLWFVASSVCASVSSEDAKRFNEAAVVLRELRNVPDKGPPEDLLGKAQCVLVIPSLKKAAFIVGGEYGVGVMSCRQAGGWSAPVFMQLLKGSLGLQSGATDFELPLLVFNRGCIENLLAD